MNTTLFPIPRAESLDKGLDSIFKSVRMGRRESKTQRFAVERRASSFPICPRAYHIYRRLPLHKRPYDNESLASEAATLMGTALHVVLQKWFGIQNQVFYGNWVCMDCKLIRKHKYGTQVCKKCGQEMLYHEYSIKHKKVPFTGHIDGLIQAPNMKILLDFKGSSMQKISAIKKMGRPYESHYYQVNAYANVVNKYPKMFGGFGPVEKIVVLYVDRGAANWAWHAVQVPISKKIYRQTLGLISEAEQSVEDLVLPNGICDSPNDSHGQWCLARPMCFSRLLEAELDDKVWPEWKRPSGKTLIERAVSEL